MQEIQPSVLYEAVTSHNTEKALQLILQLKTHVKHQRVDLQYAQQYFDSLILAFCEPRLSITAFSTLCHLIKRVRTQRPSDLKLVHSKVVPFLFERLKEPKASMRSAAMKAMVTIWESIPEDFENDLNRRGFKNSDPAIRAGLLGMIGEIAKNSTGFSVAPFLPSIVSLLADQVVSSHAMDLLILYFNDLSQHDAGSRNELVRQLSTQHISHTLSVRLLSQLTDANELIALYKKRLTRSSGSRYSTPSSRPKSSLDNQKNALSSYHRPSSGSIVSNSSGKVSDPSNTEKIDGILATFPGFDSIDRISALNYSSAAQLLDNVDLLEQPFEGKETEQNWLRRDAGIKQLQSILRGNAVKEYPVQLAQIVRGFKGCISKAVLSLRTTLSSAGCQLCKEVGMILGPYLDGPTVDSLLSSLFKLTCARKTIAHQRANLAVMSLLLYTNFSPRLMIQIYSTSQDKNVQPRVYSATWVELFLLKYAENAQIIEANQEYIDRIISKGVRDPIPSVREASRLAFWTLDSVFPQNSQQILDTLPASSVKALEKSREFSVKRTIINRSFVRRQASIGTGSGRKKITEIHRGSQDIPKPPSPVALSGLETAPQDIPPQTISSEVDGQPANSKTALALRESQSPPPHGELGGYTEKIRRENTIYDQLVSMDITSQSAGIGAILDGHLGRLPIKFNSVLNGLSISSPHILIPMFQSENSFKYLSDYLSTDNIIRLYCVFSMESRRCLTAEEISFIFRNMSIDDMVLSITNILMLCIDSSKLQDLNLSMQFVKYKLEFTEACFDFAALLFGDANIKIESYMLSSIFDALLKCWEFSDHTEGGKYISLLRTGMNRNRPLFQKCLSSCENGFMKSQLAQQLGIDPHNPLRNNEDLAAVDSNYLPSEDDFGESNLDGLTMVIRKDIDNRQVSKIDSDLTMIMPRFDKKSHRNSLDTAMEPQDVDPAMNDENVRSNTFLDTKRAKIVEADYPDEIRLGDVFLEENKREETGQGAENGLAGMSDEGVMSDTTPDMNRLTLTEDGAKSGVGRGVEVTQVESVDIELESNDPISPPRSTEEVASIIESVDPLAPLTKSSGKFSIFEDDVDHSKQIEQLDSWYGFAALKYRCIRGKTLFDSNELVSKLGDGSISYEELSFLVYALEDGKIDPKPFVSSLLGCVDAELSKDSIFASLFLMRVCMSRAYGYKEKEIFEKVVEFGKLLKENEEDELYFAVEETLHFIPNVGYYIEALRNKQQVGLTVPQQAILLEVLLHLITPTSVSYEDVFMLDVLVFKLLKSTKTVIRKLAVMIYSKLYQYREEGVKSPEGHELIDGAIFKKLDESQLALVKYYSERS
ncbi:DEKNAAC100593 [Brettanomyces naardenensis]|uniref:Protein STU1 n=1 Tax=Brettanomyces naardenensis TaxID=13370 RepID=A0A448YEP9_BRENA|nr:DEKNAAC100593 [Brettanomyces naardenensis]